MLKIAKYNTITGEKIDLKELEKYGFIYSEKRKCYFNYETGNLGGYDEICIKEDRIIQLGYEPCPYFIENYLYDLIKDGLVIKEVEE